MSLSKPTLAIQTSRTGLLELLAGAARVTASGKSIIPIYEYVLLKVAPEEDGTLIWRATNGQLWRAGRLAANIDGRGQVLIPVTLAANFVKRCADGHITIMVEGDRVTIAAAAFRAKLPTLPVEDFPLFPDTSALQAYVIDRALLARAVAHVLPLTPVFAGGKSFMKGTLLQLTDQLTMVATDAHRLSVVQAPLPSTASADGTVEALIPNSLIGELAVLLRASSASTVSFGASPDLQMFTVDGQILIGRPMTEVFPDWERLMPKKQQTFVTLDRQLWLDACRRVMVATDGEARRLNVVVTEKAVELSAQSQINGDAVDRLVPTSVSGPEVTFALEARYLAESLDTFTSESIVCEIVSPVMPLLFKPPAADGAEFTTIVMPMRV